jgi:hypothetical protein
MAPERWNEWIRARWRIEDGGPCMRDVAFAGDASRIPTASGHRRSRDFLCRRLNLASTAANARTASHRAALDNNLAPDASIMIEKTPCLRAICVGMGMAIILMLMEATVESIIDEWRANRPTFDDEDWVNGLPSKIYLFLFLEFVAILDVDLITGKVHVAAERLIPLTQVTLDVVVLPSYAGVAVFGGCHVL